MGTEMIRINSSQLSSLESQLLSNCIEQRLNKIKFETFTFDADIIEDAKGNIYVRYVPKNNIRGDLE